MWILLSVNENTMSSKLFRMENIMTVKLRRRPWTLFPNFTKKTKDSSLMSVTVTSTVQRVLSDISEDISHVHLLPNTRLPKLMMVKLPSFSMIWLAIKRKLTLLCLLKNLSHRFSFICLLKTLKW